MRTSKTAVVILFLTLFIFFVPSAAFDLLVQKVNTAQACGKLQCSFDDGKETTFGKRDIARVELISVTAMGGGDEVFFAVQSDGAGGFVRAQGVEQGAVTRSKAIDMSFKADATSVVLTAFIARTVGVTDDVNDCEDLSLYHCFIETTTGDFKEAERREEDAGKPNADGATGGGSVSGDDELTVAASVLEIMTTLADGIEKFDILMGVRSEMVQNSTEDVKSKMLKDTDDYMIDFYAKLNGVRMSIRSSTKESIAQLVTSRDSINTELDVTTNELEKEIEDLIQDMDKSLESTNTNLTATIEKLSQSVSNEIVESDQNTDQKLKDFNNTLQNMFNTLDTSVQSLDKRTSENILNIKNTVQTEVSDSTTLSRESFDAIRINANDDFKSLQEDLNTQVANLEKVLGESITETSQTMTKNSESLEENFDEHIKLVLQSVREINHDLSVSVEKTSEDLVSYLSEVESNVTNGVDNVQNKIDLETASLLNQISKQIDATENKVESSRTSVLKIIEEATESLVNSSQVSTQTIENIIGEVGNNLSSSEKDLQVELNGLETSLDTDIQSVNSSISTRISTVDKLVTSKIDSASTEITGEISTVKDEQEKASGSNLDKTIKQISEVQEDFSQRMSSFNSTIHDNINSLEENTNKIITKMDISVTDDLSSITNNVEIIASETQDRIGDLTQRTKDNIISSKNTLIEDIEKLHSLTSSFIQTAHTKTDIELEKMDRTLSSSLAGLETKTMENMGTVEKETKKDLGELQDQADGIGQKVASLGKEIGVEQAQINTLQNKYVKLTAQLAGITDQLGQFQSDLIHYQDTSKNLFSEANKEINARGEDTLEHLSGVVAKVKGMSETMTTALQEFHVSVDELSAEIVDIGTKVTDFTQANINQIINGMEQNTQLIASYLQPRQCVRHMNYMSISNNQYVVIAPNEDSDIDFEILCDTASDGGGWIIIQNRVNNDISFYKDWAEYREGFGFLQTDFYMGNERIHNLTTTHEYELRITVENDEQEYIADYDSFYIDSERNQYRLHVGKYSGTAGDAFTYHNGMPFSTRDRDNDKSRRRSCATADRSGWWFNNCRMADLNGEWQKHMYWLKRPLSSATIHTTEMKMRLKKKRNTATANGL